ncbi:hypothetical protein BT93_H2205 [Corymbia citriodora subsp. variegata]|nr:hypothetical protein BT93_H2205 [Corymbia citriodora subsp. variegata]
MPSPPFIPLFLFGFILASAISSATATAEPAPLIFPVKKDDSINQYYTTLRLGTPPTAMDAVLDLGGCGYKSSSFRPVPCHSSRCRVMGGNCIDCSGPVGPTCANDTCSFILAKPFSDIMVGKGLGEDVLVLPSSNGIEHASRTPPPADPAMQDLAKSLLRTQLLVNPGDPVPISNDGDGYSINVTAIKVDFSPINVKNGIGGVIFRSLYPYTVLQSAIFKPLVKEFTKKAKDRKIKQAAPVTPFGACFDAKTVKSGVAGPDVPAIVLVLQGDAQWRIEGANSMVMASKDVMCLGFVDSGSNYGYAIMIGGHQMEDNLMEFDVRSSTFGFSNSLLLQNSSCSHF